MSQGEEIGNEYSYSIYIAGRRFHITSTDSEQHIRKLETKIANVLTEVGIPDGSPQLSQTALKILLRLADEVVRIEENTSHMNNIDTLYKKRIRIMLQSLDSALTSEA